MDYIGFISLFGLSALELWAGIPLGFAMRLNPVLIFAISVAGSAASAAVVIFAGDALRKLFLKNKNEKKKEGKAAAIWKKYGAAGLGLLSPLLFGAPLGAALGIALGAERGRLMLWMSAGIIIWAAALTAAGVAGLNIFHAVKQ